jgi:hypothetical protein
MSEVRKLSIKREIRKLKKKVAVLERKIQPTRFIPENNKGKCKELKSTTPY